MDISDVMMKCTVHGTQLGLIKAIYGSLHELSCIAKSNETCSDLELQKAMTAIFNLEIQVRNGIAKRQLQLETEVE